jgi:hypothetical protein
VNGHLNGNEDSTGIDVEGLSKCSQVSPTMVGTTSTRPALVKRISILPFLASTSVELVQVFEICNAPFDTEQEIGGFYEELLPV